MERLTTRFRNGMVPTETHFNAIVDKVNEIIDEGTGKVQSDIVDLGEFARSGLGEAKAASIPYCSDPSILMMKYTITGQGVAIIHQSVNEARSTQYLVLAGFWFTRYITFTSAQRTAISQVTAWHRTMPTNVDYNAETHRIRLMDYNRQHSLPLNNANDGFVIPSASTTTDGLMSKEDKAKIDDSLSMLRGTSADSSANTDPQLMWKTYSASQYGSWDAMIAQLNADLDALDITGAVEGAKYNGWLVVNVDGIKFRILHTTTNWNSHHYVDIAIGPIRATDDGKIIVTTGNLSDFVLTRYCIGSGYTKWKKLSEGNAPKATSTKCAAYYYNTIEDAISVKDSRIQDGDTIVVYRTKKRRLSRHIEGSEDTVTYTKGGRQLYENENNSFVIDGRGNNGYIHLRIRSNEVGGGGIYGIKEYVGLKYNELSYAADCYKEGDLAGFWDSYREYQVISDKMMNLECDCELVVMRNGEVVCDGIFIKVRQTFTPTGNRVENEETGMVVWVKEPVDTQVQIK